VNYSILCPTVEQVEGMLSLVQPLVETALARCKGEAHFPDLLRMARAGQLQFWLIFDIDAQMLVGVCTTEVVVYPSTLRCLRIVTLGGEGMLMWQQFLDAQLSSYCQDLGISRMEAFGRAGLIKRLQQLGFQATYMTFMKEVGNGKDSRNERDNLNDKATGISAAIH